MRPLIGFCFWLFAATALGATYGEGLAAFQRSDFNTARTVIAPLAESGDAQSQYLYGRMHATGDGVLQDFIEAHKWLNLAAARGVRAARTERDRVAGSMTAAQIAQAQAAARNWKATPRPSSAVATSSPRRASPAPAPAARQLSSINSGNVVKDVQAMLTELGYDPGPVDGAMGRRTRSAIRTYQLHSDLPVNGQATPSLRQALAQDLGYATTADAPSAPTTVVAPTPPPAVTPRTNAPSVSNNQDPIYRRAVRPSSNTSAIPDASANPALADLKRIIDEGERNRRADRRILEDLRTLLGRYDWPWRKLIVEDNFRDGNYTRNPAWQVVAGKFWIGAREGLRSQVSPNSAATRSSNNNQQLGIALLGALLGQPKQATATGPAVISLARSIPGTFAVRLQLLSGARSGKLEFGMYRGENASRGLRLVYQPGASKSLELVRVRGNERRSIATFNQTLKLEDGRSHEIVWTRDSAGRMRVTVDARPVLESGPRQGRRGNSAFDGFFISNLGGNYGVQNVRIFGD
jgi:peptidoglycan hydrolase-like protein with peptidoglycan-binding domain